MNFHLKHKEQIGLSLAILLYSGPKQIGMMLAHIWEGNLYSVTESNANLF
jgi:hypothetical protein